MNNENKVALFFLYGLFTYICRRYLIDWVCMKNYTSVMKQLCPESVINTLIQLWVHSNYLYLSASCTGVMKLLPSLVLVDWLDGTAFSIVGMSKEDHLPCFSMMLVELHCKDYSVVQKSQNLKTIDISKSIFGFYLNFKMQF